jgi:ketosteroid isomerase-like protein
MSQHNVDAHSRAVAAVNAGQVPEELPDETGSLEALAAGHRDRAAGASGPKAPRHCEILQMMSQEHSTSSALELTRRSFEAADSGDFDLMISFYGPDSVFDMSPWGLGTYAGLPAIRSFFEDWIGAFDEFEMKLEEVVDLGGGLVFAVARQRARSAGSRTDLELRHAAVAEWAEGVAALVTNYPDIDEGRAAATAAAESKG